MATWVAWGFDRPPSSLGQGVHRTPYYPCELTRDGSKPVRPRLDGPNLIKVQVFDAEDPDDARMHYLKLQRDGLNTRHRDGDIPVRVGRARLWRFRGTPAYLTRAAERLGVSIGLADKAKFSKELHSIAGFLVQLTERYHGTAGRIRADLSPGDQAQARGTLMECERYVSMLHTTAAAAANMLDEAWAAHGLETPKRRFEVMSDLDDTADHHDVATEQLTCAGV